VSLLVTKVVNVNNTYIGAKIIKPDGKEVIVNTGEEVLLKNETKDQKGKLAIPGFAGGRLLDYYVSNVDILKTGKPTLTRTMMTYLCLRMNILFCI